MSIEQLLGELTIVGIEEPSAPPPTPVAEVHPSKQDAEAVREFLKTVHERCGFGPVAELFESYAF